MISDCRWPKTLFRLLTVKPAPREKVVAIFGREHELSAGETLTLRRLRIPRGADGISPLPRIVRNVSHRAPREFTDGDGIGAGECEKEKEKCARD